MKEKTKDYLWKGIVVWCVLILIAVFWYADSYNRSVVPQRTFQVSGEGKVIATPDVAEITFGIITQGDEDLTELQEENSEKMNRIISFLQEEGISKDDIKTQYYNVSPRYSYQFCPPFVDGRGDMGMCPPSEITGYTINQSVLVKIKDLDAVGKVLAGVVEFGANTVYGPNFTVDDLARFQNEARIQAMQEAHQKAKDIASAGGFRLGKLITLHEGFNYPRIMPELDGFGRGVDIDATIPDIEPGVQEIIINVTLTYEIK